MENQVKVSVILPSLNVRPYIEECVESIINQTLFDIEILCIDAGSSDGTYEILQRFAEKDPRIKLITSDKKSYGYQVNVGFKMARGEYVGIVETDDYIDYDMYEQLYNFAKSTGKPDFVKGNISEFGKYQGNLLEWQRAHSSRDYNVRIDISANREFSFLNYGTVWDGIYKREFLQEKKLFFQETPGAAYQDTSFLILLAVLAESALYLERPFYHYRVDNIGSSVKQQQLWKAVMDEFSFLEIQLKERGIDNAEISTLCLKEKINVYWWNYRRLSIAEFRDCFLKEAKKDLLQMRQTLIERVIGGEKYQELVDRMLEDDYQFVENQKNKTRDFIEHSVSGYDEYVIVGAGQWCEAILFIQRCSQRQFVKAVCDNSPDKQGTEYGGYEIKSLEDAVEDNREKQKIKWMIANKNHYEEIKDQLTRLGIMEEKIQPYFMIPGKKELFEMFLERETRLS